MLFFRQTLTDRFWAWAHVHNATSRNSTLLRQRQRLGQLRGTDCRWYQPDKFAGSWQGRVCGTTPALKRQAGVHAGRPVPSAPATQFTPRWHISTSCFSFTKSMRNRGEEGRLRGMRIKRFLKNSPFRVCFNILIYGFEVSITWGCMDWQRTDTFRFNGILFLQ